MNRHALLIAMVLVLCACSSETPPPPAQPDAPVKTVLDDQLKALDKAKTVEDIGMEHKRKIDEQLDNGD